MPVPLIRPQSLRFKLIAMCVAIAGCSALAVAWTCTQFQARALEDSGRELQLSFVHEIAQFTQLQRERTQRDLQALGHALTQHEWGSQAQLTVAFALLESMPGLDELRIYDASGRCLDRITQGERSAQVQEPLAPDIQDAAVQAGTWADPRVTTGPKPRQLWVHALRAQGQLTGFIASSVRLDSLQQHLRRTASLQLANTEHALYISSLEGDILLSSVSQGPWANGRRAPEISSIDLQSLRPDLGVVQDLAPTSDDAAGQLTTALRMSAQPWLVVARVPSSAAFAPLKALHAHLLRSVLFILAASMLLAFVLSRRVSRPISALVAMAKRLEQGRFDHTALLRRNDELGEVARAMSLAAKDLALQDLHSARDTHDNAAPASQTRKQKQA